MGTLVGIILLGVLVVAAFSNSCPKCHGTGRIKSHNMICPSCWGSKKK